jgi:SPP1 gp7 family putative phage head morphogenesis protein
MLAVDAAAELEAFSGFYGALYAREFWGDHVCCAAQPDEANGSPEDLVLAGIDEGAAETGRWAEQIVEAVSDRSSVNSLLSAIGTLAERLDIAPFARVVERRLLHGIMLGALDSEWEREHEEELKPATFAVEPGLPEGAFSNLPYADAVRLFNEKKVLPKSAFDTLEQGARRTAFTVARMASSEMLNVTKAELARMLNEGRQRPEVGPDGVARKPGANLRDFRKFAAARLESAGWTPANKSHVETIYRTNILTGYASGGFVEKRKPEVLAALPYWQIRGVRDSRARPTHKAAFGIVLRADHPFWKKAYPPFGYNCRCRIVARSVAWMKANGVKLGPVPTDLPDPGFDSGTTRLISVPDAALTPAAPKVEAVPVPPVPTVGGFPVDPGPPLPPPLPLPLELPSLPPPPATPLPKVKKPPVASAANILGKKLSDATGSNPGGIYEGLDGKKRYVKFYTDPAQAAGEDLANKIYGELGLGKVKSTTFLHEGKLAYASELLDEVTMLKGAGLTPGRAKKALEGFAADVLVANWDAAGLSLDNLVVDKAGKIYRIDNGGALLSRANAGRKPQSMLNSPTEWIGFFKPEINPAYSKLAQTAGVASAEEIGKPLVKSIERIVKVREKVGGWAAFVEKHAKNLPAFERQQVAGMLEARTQFLEQQLAKLKAAKLPKTPAATAKRDWASLERRPLPKARKEPIAGLGRRAYLEQSSRRLENTVGLPERVAISDFTGSEYGDIRRAARMTEDEWLASRGATGLGSETARAQYRQFRAKADAIDRAFETAASSAPQALEAQLGEMYRGVGGLPEAVFDRMLNASTVRFASPGSMTWKVDVARSFADRHGGRRVVFVFRPKAELARNRLVIEPVSNVAEEGEVLARRGSSWRVVEVARTADDDRALIYLEEIDDAGGGAVSLRAPASSSLLASSHTS